MFKAAEVDLLAHADTYLDGGGLHLADADDRTVDVFPILIRILDALVQFVLRVLF